MVHCEVASLIRKKQWDNQRTNGRGVRTYTNVQRWSGMSSAEITEISSFTQGVRFSQRCCRRFSSSGMLRLVGWLALVFTSRHGVTFQNTWIYKLMDGKDRRRLRLSAVYSLCILCSSGSSLFSSRKYISAGKGCHVVIITRVRANRLHGRLKSST